MGRLTPAASRNTVPVELTQQGHIVADRVMLDHAAVVVEAVQVALSPLDLPASADTPSSMPSWVPDIGRRRHDERELRAAIEGGDSDAIAASSTRALCNLGTLLAQQPGRKREAEAAYREAAEAGQSDGWLGLGGLAVLGGRKADAEAAHRAAIAAGETDAWARLGRPLAKQPGREREAEVAYRAAIDSGAATDATLNPAVGLGEILARQGDVAGARAAFETHARAVAMRMDTELPDAIFAAVARVNTAVARHPRARRRTRAIRGAIRRPTRR